MPRPATLNLIKEYLADHAVELRRKGVPTLYMIIMTPKMRTGCVDAGSLRHALDSVA
jgi:hypothetical protein